MNPDWRAVAGFDRETVIWKSIVRGCSAKNGRGFRRRLAVDEVEAQATHELMQPQPKKGLDRKG